jgi:hypothetical protein
MTPTTRSRLTLALLLGGGTAAVVGAAMFFSRRSRLNGLGRAEPKERLRAGNMTLAHYRDGTMSINKRVGLIQDLVWKGVKQPQLRELALAITGNGDRSVTVGKRTFRVRGASCPARDGKCEAAAVGDWVHANIRYTGDISPVKMGRNGPIEGVDLFQGPWRTIEFGGGDCLPQGTLLLTEGHKFTPIENTVIGSRIWGRDSWTTVKDIWFKGVLPVDAIYLNNGSSFKATPDHKVYVALCKHSPATRCSCPMTERSIERIHVSAVEPGMVLVTPDQIAFGEEEMDPSRAYIEGLYLADGWQAHKHDFDIAGRDGHPKEAQKEEIAAICEELGIPTYRHEKYIRVKDSEWALRIAQMGHRAPLKHALSIALQEDAAGELLRGIMADAGQNTRGNGSTFTTTSRELALQVRLLHKMFGVTCSERYIVDHGGLGENPIWRLGVRDQNRSDGYAEKLLRVKAVERDVMSLPVWDISTEDHYVYLPEADVTVSNCDDHAALNATLLSLNGVPAKMRVTAPAGYDWAHIYAMAGLPKTRPAQWATVDTTLTGYRFGKEAPYGKKADFAA